MIVYEIPLPREPEPFFTQRIVLSGREYVFSFSWSGRCERWFLEIQTTTETPIISGVVLTAGLPLTSFYVGDDLFPGNLLLGSATPDTLESLSTTILFYVEN